MRMGTEPVRAANGPLAPGGQMIFVVRAIQKNPEPELAATTYLNNKHSL